MPVQALVVPLDASQVPAGERKTQKVKVVVRNQKGVYVSESAPLDSGKAEVKLGVDSAQSLEIAVGPLDTPDEDLFHLQTITARVLPRQWRGQNRLVLNPLIITPWYWRFWLRWCREITITGRVVCPSGRPAPGAHVSAFDVDFWWWWFSAQQVGATAVTDANGAFTIQFRWCCGWWPWWWWRLRRWRLEPLLANRILPAARLSQRFKKLPRPGPDPDLRVFQDLVPNEPLPPVGPDFDPSILPQLREKLLPRLPQLPELERLRIWPWWPWTPWLDCSPDIIFRATQECQGETRLIVNESVFQARWDSPANLNVTLTANSEACCIGGHPGPEGDCLLINDACQVVVGNIGGNLGAPPAPVGYASPGGTDRPFSGNISVRGQFGAASNVDYYEFEHTLTPAVPASWAPLAPPIIAGFNRQYWNGVTWPLEPFPVQNVDGHFVIESREHFEAVNGPRFWESTGEDMLGVLISDGNLADNTHHFRVRSYGIDAGGHLVNPRILPVCLTQHDNGLALRIDNRFVDTVPPFSSPATSPGQPCGAGTVHFCTDEPDTQILSVLVNGQPLQACGSSTVKEGQPLEIEFLSYDPDSHLDHYTLVAHYDVNLSVNLLALGTLSPGAPAGIVPPAAQEGPTYAAAVAQGAPRPVWSGGTLHLTIPNVLAAFPKTCCYLLELTAWKRNIVNCSGPLVYYNQSHFSVTIIV
jgi:hypothetical protein